MVDSVSRRAKPVHLSRKVVWVGSERALSEVEGVRLMVLVKVERLRKDTVTHYNVTRQEYTHDFGCNNFRIPTRQRSGDRVASA